MSLRCNSGITTMDEYWLTIAKTLRLNENRKIQCCGTGSDRSMRVYNKPSGYSCWCFRCGKQEWRSHGLQSLQLLQYQRSSKDWLEARAFELPSDLVSVPVSNRLWLLKAGVGDYLTEHYGIKFSPSMHRIVIPVYHPVSGVLDLLQSRAVYSGQKPKYLNKYRDASLMRSTIFWSKADTLLCPSTCTRTLVITEDILSAIRVGRIVASCSLLGTALTDECITQIVSQYDRIILWLDPDKAGVKGTKKMTSQLKLCGLDVTSIESTKDPKYYCNDDIRRILKDGHE